MQIMEREKDVMKKIFPRRQGETDRVCKNWDEWLKHPDTRFEQNDSGI